MAEDLSTTKRLITDQYFLDLKRLVSAVAVKLETDHGIDRHMNLDNIIRIAKAMTRRDV